MDLNAGNGTSVDRVEVVVTLRVWGSHFIIHRVSCWCCVSAGLPQNLMPAALFEVWDTGSGLQGVDVPRLFESPALLGEQACFPPTHYHMTGCSDFSVCCHMCCHAEITGDDAEAEVSEALTLIVLLITAGV